MGELYRTPSPVTGEQPKLACVAKHVRQRHHRLDDLGAAPAVGALDLAAPAVDVADHVTEIIRGSHDLDLDHRLEDLDPGRISNSGSSREMASICSGPR